MNRAIVNNNDSPAELIRDDIARVLPYFGDADGLEDASFFLTGGTGFVGVWLINALLALSEQRSLGLRITVLTRNPERFERLEPELASRVRLWRGDILDFKFPQGDYKYIIHAATETDGRLIEAFPEKQFDSIVNGTRRVLDFAAERGCRRLLYVSSGAVYGRQPPEISHIAEDYTGAPDITMSGERHAVYGEGKRAAELFCRLRELSSGLEILIARLFAFAGPYLPTDGYFAIGNFIKDVLEGRKIVISGDGTPVRSYMHPADLALWLLVILCRGCPVGAYNVGSDEEISIRDTAALVADEACEPIEIEIRKQPNPGVLPDRYVPSVERAKRELGLGLHFGLRESVVETLNWHRLLSGNKGVKKTK